MFGHQRLDEEGALLGIEAGANPIGHVVVSVRDDLARIRIVRRQRVPIDDTMERIVLGLQLDPVLERAHEMTEMQLSGRAHARQHALFGHGNPRRSRAINAAIGQTKLPSTPVSIKAYKRMKPYGRSCSMIRAPAGGSTPISTFPPSSGGTGIMLNTASSTLMMTNPRNNPISGAENALPAMSPGGLSGMNARTRAPAIAIAILLAGPAAAIRAKSRFGCRR